MHFSIPYAEEVKEGDKTHHVYKIYINGVHHGSCRYSQFFDLNESLKNEVGLSRVPPFPPKKIFGLTETQLKERRQQLERFLQFMSSSPQLSCHPAFSEFLANAHKDCMKIDRHDVDLDIFLMDGSKVTVRVGNTDKNSTVLENYAAKIGLADKYIFYFGLYLIRKEDDGELSIVRQLQDFECPFISLQEAGNKATHKIVVRKTIWDPQLEAELMSDLVAVNLLYSQTLSDLDRGWIEVKDEARQRQLASLRQKESRKEFLQLCRTLRFYNYIHLRPCMCDYPSPDTPVQVVVGSTEIVFQLTTKKGKTKEVCLPITRIRTWRIMTVTDDQQKKVASNGAGLQHELSFEYLVERGTLKWIRVYADTPEQIILMSMCLQSIVDELVMKQKEGGRFKKSHDRKRNQNTSTAGANNGLGGRMTLSSLMSHQAENESFTDAIGDEDL